MSITNLPVDFKSEVHRHITTSADDLLQMLEERPSARAIEVAVWKHGMSLVALMLTLLFARRCAMATEDELQRRDLRKEDVYLRLSEDYHASLMTTAGPVRFPLYAYRVKDGVATQIDGTRAPARHDVFPMYPKCRSTPLCLEWETRLGSDHPFRFAEQEIKFFSHEAVTTEDNTISRHLVHASNAIDRSWLYKTPDEIRQVLCERAMVDLKTGKPVVYASSDAHALRRYVDETWDRQWKMANGIRLWCVDRDTGDTIHLGGEFTWGNCEHVAAIFSSLIEAGILPRDGDYGDGVVAQLVWLSDGAPWFKERILPLLGPSTVIILDAYHVLERAAEYAKIAFRDPKQAAGWLNRFKTALIDGDFVAADAVQPTMVSRNDAADGSASAATSETRRLPRKGHKKSKRAGRAEDAVRDRAAMAAKSTTTSLDGIADVLEEPTGKNALEAYESLCAYLGDNDARINYLEFRERGLQIGSGAMESMHKSGSQLRLKRPGATYLQSTSQALLNWRMLRLAGRWDQFWAQPSLDCSIAATWDETADAMDLQNAA